MTKWDDIRDIFMACWATVCEGPIRKVFEKILPIVRYCQLSMSAVFLIAVDTLSNTTESEKTNKLIDEPEQDVQNIPLWIINQFVCFLNCSLENAINKPHRWSRGKVRVNGRPIL